MSKSSILKSVIFLSALVGDIWLAEAALTVNSCLSLTNAPVSTNLDQQGWNFSPAVDTRSGGHIEYVSTGLHVYTDSSTSLDKAVGLKAVNVALADIGDPSIVFSTFTGGRAGIQLAAYDGDIYKGFIVGEPWAYGDGNFWSHADFGIGSPYAGIASFGNLTTYLQANPNLVIKAIGFSLGSGVKGDQVITSITAGCTVYTWKLATLPPTATSSLKCNQVNPFPRN
jgi:hypothetical protein